MTGEEAFREVAGVTSRAVPGKPWMRTSLTSPVITFKSLRVAWIRAAKEIEQNSGAPSGLVRLCALLRSPLSRAPNKGHASDDFILFRESRHRQYGESNPPIRGLRAFL